MNIELVPSKAHPITQEDLALLLDEYTMSFPEEERRPWDSILSTDFLGTLYFIYADGQLAGFVTLWELNLVLYIEHLLIISSFRNHGIGAHLLKTLISFAQGTPLLLECEPAHASPMAQRRLDFYKRAGFYIQDIDYIQPPYKSGGIPVPLHLLSTEEFTAYTLKEIERQLHHKVYGWSAHKAKS